MRSTPSHDVNGEPTAALHALDTDALHTLGETTETATWLLLASTAGRFRPVARTDQWVDIGELVGHVVRSGEESPVHSARAGRLMGLLADDGELVRDFQPVAWLQLAS